MRYAIALLMTHTLSFPALAQEIDIDIPYEKFQLSNGLTVIVHEDRKAPIVAVNVWYHVGSKNEKRGKTGFAHLFEHLMFNGSEHYNDDYFKVLEKLGATDLNGTTNEDRTNYFQNVPTSALDTVLWMESDRMGYMLGAVDQAKLDEQRGVVKNEKRQLENQPYGKASMLITENTYPAGHPYSWPVIGYMEDLDAATLDDVREWFKTYYGPSNAVVVLAGDIDVKTAREKVERYFGAIPPGPPVPRQQEWIAKLNENKWLIVQDRVPQARIYKVWNIPPLYVSESDMLFLAAQVLGTGKTSRLYRRLVDQERIATDANAFVSLQEIGGQFFIISTAKPDGDVKEVERVLHEELARLLREGPTADELERVKTRYLANFIRGIERIGGFGGKSDVLASGEVYTGDPGAYKRRLRNIQRATPEMVRDAARKWLSAGWFALEVHPFPDYKALPKDVDRSKVPEPGPPPSFKMPTLHRRTLSNGLKIVLSERHNLPLVNFTLLVDSGYAADQFAEAGTARLAMSMIDEGTKTRTSQEIADALERLGAVVSANATLDHCMVSLSALKDRLDESLEIFADVVLNPSFPEGDFEREKRLQIAAIQREKAQPVTMAQRVLPALLYGKGHAYANPLTGSGTEASVERIGREHLVKFHADWFKPNNATVVVVGDTTLDEVTQKLERLFVGWKPGDVPKKNLASAPHQNKRRVYLIDRPGSLQSLIIAGHLAPPKNDPGDIAFETLNRVLGGAFLSRINMNLREEKHWSYGAGAVLMPAVGQRPYFVYAPVQTDKTKESMIEIDKEVRQILSERPVTAEELATAQDGLTLRLPGARETSNQLANSIAEIVRFGLPDDYWDTYPSKVRALKREDMLAAARKLLRPDGMVWIIVGDRAKIEAGIRELNLGELHFIDADGNPGS
jgi:zinc protease